MFCLLSIGLVLLSSLMSPATGQAGPVVDTTSGPVRGFQTNKAMVFKGIPYARAPVEDLRWQPPQEAVPWRPHIFNATESAPGCPQTHCTDNTPPIACPNKTSEDCLSLEIYAPLGTKNGSNLPVMLFIHGGNFFTMASSSPIFDGEVFVQRGHVVLVNINYRLGALGFLVTGRDKKSATGNYGLLDQRFAMRWVNTNIRAFGGDPAKVTIFGQSAGAQSAINHMTSDESSPYFHYVISESAPMALPYKNFEEAFILGGLLAEELNCSVADLQCMRSKSAEEIAAASYKTRSEIASTKFLELFEPWGPWIDGSEVKGQPYAVYNAGKFNKKPMIIGTLTEETVLYIYGAFKTPVDLAKYVAIIALTKPSDLGKVIAKYPPLGTSEDQREVLVNISTDLVFLCVNRNVSRAILKHNVPVWSYVWAHAFSFPGWGPVTYCQGRVCHASELPFVFDTAYLGNFTMTADETTLSHNTITYWTNFAWTGDPNVPPTPDHRPKSSSGQENGSGRGQFVDHMTRGSRAGFQRQKDLLKWPAYSEADAQMWFQTPSSTIVSNYRKEYCDFWDTLGYKE